MTKNKNQYLYHPKKTVKSCVHDFVNLRDCIFGPKGIFPQYSKGKNYISVLNYIGSEERRPDLSTSKKCVSAHKLMIHEHQASNG